GGLMAVVACKVDCDDMPVSPCEAEHLLPGRIRGTIIDEHDLVRLPDLGLADLRDPLVERVDASRFVVARDGYRQGNRWSLIEFCESSHGSVLPSRTISPKVVNNTLGPGAVRAIPDRPNPFFTNPASVGLRSLRTRAVRRCALVRG